MQTELTLLVDETKHEWRSKPFVWGRYDCISSVCEYVRKATGVDAFRPWRGTYSSEAEAINICDNGGGLLATFANGMRNAGFYPCESAFGLPVVVNFQGKQFAGIDLGRRVMLRMERGMVEWPCEVLGAWDICQR